MALLVGPQVDRDAVGAELADGFEERDIRIVFRFAPG
jgi:hypothetical protein